MRNEIAQADFPRHVARRARHELHQACRSGAGARIGDEPALLAHEAEHPGFVQALGLRVLAEHIAEGNRIAEREIMKLLGAVGGIDGAVVYLLPPSELGSREEPRIAVAANRE